MLAVALILVSATGRAELEVPQLEARVNDRAGVLPAADEQALERRLAAYEAETGHQIAVLTIETLEGEPIESFSLRVVETWKIGHEGVDNGALILVAVEDRAARIEVGYGLEGAVPDATAKRVLEDVMFPEFREGRVAEGILAGAVALMQAASGETWAAPNRPSKSHGQPEADFLVPPLLFGVFLAPVVAAFFPGHKRRAIAALVGGVVAGGVTFLLTRVLGLALIALAVGVLFGAVSRAGRNGVGRSGGWGSSGGGWSGGGSFGGGFSGGGGHFGGGGASGRW